MLKKLWLNITTSPKKYAKGLKKFHASHKILDQLSSMTDYQLRDIGIKRGDIPHIAFGRQVNGSYQP
jgi:uncharacterized protein YjiS (DUF1127 family)